MMYETAATMWPADTHDERVTHAARLATLSRMVAAAAADRDREHCSAVGHRYLKALTAHLVCCGRASWDGDDGLARAAQQLLLLQAARRVITSAIAGTPDVRAAQELVAQSNEYDIITRRASARRSRTSRHGVQP